MTFEIKLNYVVMRIFMYRFINKCKNINRRFFQFMILTAI